MVRTRVGYAGGTLDDPTYHRLGDHSETIQIDYDPAQISYGELLAVFWESHNGAARPWSRQYASLIFYHDEEQKRLAEESWAREAERHGGQLFTEIVPFSKFYPAEAYHQKYRLRSRSRLWDAARALYPGEGAFVDSTLAARLNGYVAGYGTLETVQAAVDELGMAPEAGQDLLEMLTKFSR